jgi:hypothetical protein
MPASYTVGGGMDSTYWFPWKYAGVRFQGTASTSR